MLVLKNENVGSFDGNVMPSLLRSVAMAGWQFFQIGTPMTFAFLRNAFFVKDYNCKQEAFLI